MQAPSVVALSTLSKADCQVRFKLAVMLSASETSPHEALPTKSVLDNAAHRCPLTRTGFAGGFFLRQNDGIVGCQSALDSVLSASETSPREARPTKSVLGNAVHMRPLTRTGFAGIQRGRFFLSSAGSGPE